MPRLIYPNGPQDQAGVIAYARAIRDVDTAFWDSVTLQAWKNILFLLGNQRIRYSPAIRFWRPMTQDRSRLPVTNMVKTLWNDLASKLVAFKPPITWGPGSDQDADYIAATVADQVNTVIEKEANIRELKAVGARTLGATGNVFLVSNYDVAFEHGVNFEPAQRCQHCNAVSMPMDREATGGACPQCKSLEPVADPMTGAPVGIRPVPRFQPALDGSASPIGVEYPKGRHVTEIENVFTVRFDPRDRFSKSPYYSIRRSRPESWIAERYGDAFAAQAQYRTGSDLTTRLLDSIAVTAFGMSGGGSPEDERTAVVTRLWIRPHPEKAPQGIYAELVGDQIAVGRDGPVCMEYPYKDEAGRAMLNIAHIEFDQIPGRGLAATRMDDAVELQEDLNEYDAFIKQHARRMANAVWAIPRGANVSALTGEEGLYIEYDPLQTGHKPERQPGMPIGQDIVMVRNQKKAEMQEVWGSTEVSRGEVPSRVSAYAALQFLDERSQQGQSNVFDNWALGWMEWSRQNINIARQCWTEDRMLSLGVGRWASQKFSQAQIQGGVDISVDLGMNRPTTMIAKSARIGQARAQGFLNPMDPQVQFRAFRALGIPDMMPDYNNDYIKAGRVLDRIINAQTPQELLQVAPPPAPYDIHPVHLQVLRQFEVTEQFEALEPWKKEAIQLRMMIHYQADQQNMLRQQKSLGPPNGPGDGGGGTGGGGEGDKGDYTTENTILDKETQGASPDTMTGATAEMALGA